MSKKQKIQKTGLPKNYRTVLENIKTRIKSAQLKAAQSVNTELNFLYFYIGKEIVEKQEKDGWGNSTVEQLATDLQKDFPGIKGFSTRNIWRMRSFYVAYSGNLQELPQAVAELKKPKLSKIPASKEIIRQTDRDFKGQKLPQLVAELPWGHNTVLIEKIKNLTKRLWYAQKTVEDGWSRAVLVHQIESKLFERQAKSEKLTNFMQTLPDGQSDLAHEMVKDPYNFDFLTLDTRFNEQKVHRGLIQHLKAFLIELGVGFAFVGSEYHLEIGDQDFYIDLLFYHLRLRCFVVIELKTVSFQPEFAGKMNFYLSAVDDLLRHQEDRPTIGIILCKSKNKTVVEYALKDSKKPMGVSAYKLTHFLPEKFKGKLPSVKQIEEELKRP